MYKARSFEPDRIVESERCDDLDDMSTVLRGGERLEEDIRTRKGKLQDWGNWNG
jgi:hypothetical protein